MTSIHLHDRSPAAALEPAWITDAPHLDALGVDLPDASDPEGPLALDEARGLVFTVREGQLRAWKLDDGSPLWSRPAASGPVALGVDERGAVLVAHRGGVLSLGPGDESRPLLALDLAQPRRPLAVDPGSGLALFARGRMASDREGYEFVAFDELEVWSLGSGERSLELCLYVDLHRALFIDERHLALVVGTIAQDVLCFDLVAGARLPLSSWGALSPLGVAPGAALFKVEQGESLSLVSFDGSAREVARGDMRGSANILVAPDGRRALLFNRHRGEDGAWLIEVDLATGQPSPRVRIGLDPVRAGRLLRDGRLLCLAGTTLRTWDLARPALPRPRSAAGHALGGPVLGLCFSPAGEGLVATSPSGELALFRGPERVATVPGAHGGRGASVPPGLGLAFLDEDRLVRLRHDLRQQGELTTIDARSGEIIARIADLGHSTHLLGITGSGLVVTSSASPSRVRLIDPMRGVVVAESEGTPQLSSLTHGAELELPETAGQIVARAVFSIEHEQAPGAVLLPGPRVRVVAASVGRLRLFEPGAPAPLSELPFRPGFGRLTLGPRGDRLAVSSEGGGLWLVALEEDSLRLVAELPVTYASEAAFLGDRLLVLHAPGAALFDADGRQVAALESWTQHAPLVSPLLPAAGGALGRTSQAVVRFDAEGDSLSARTLLAHPARHLALRGADLLVLSRDALTILDPVTGDERAVLSPDHPLLSLAVSTRGAVAYGDSMGRIARLP